VWLFLFRLEKIVYGSRNPIMIADKKILIVSNTSWNIYNYRLGLLNSLENRGARITVVAPPDNYSQKIGYDWRPVRIHAHGTNPFQDLKLIVDFYRIYRRLKPDVVLHYTIKPNVYGTLAAHRLGIPVINNVAGLGVLFGRESLHSKIARRLYKYSQRYAYRVFFQNCEDRDYFLTRRLVDPAVTDKLPGSGIDTHAFRPLPKTRRRDRFVFLLMARLIWQKGIGEYVRAAEIVRQKHPEVECQILGFLDKKNPSAVSPALIRRWVDNGSIDYLGATNNVKDYLRQADCVVLPSYYKEGVPRTLIEAAAMARPIITTDQVGCRDVVEDGWNGYLCQKRNAEDLARRMETMLRLPPHQRIMMGWNGRMKVLHEFDEKFVIDKYLHAIDALPKSFRDRSVPRSVASPVPTQTPESFPVRIPAPALLQVEDLFAADPALRDTPEVALLSAASETTSPDQRSRRTPAPKVIEVGG